MNHQMNDINRMMNDMNVNDDDFSINNNLNNKQSSLILFFQHREQKYQKEVPFNKTLKEILEEIAIEHPNLKKIISNIRDNTVMCDGILLDITKTLKEINDENNVLEDNSVILIPEVNTVIVDN